MIAPGVLVLKLLNGSSGWEVRSAIPYTIQKLWGHQKVSGCVVTKDQV